MYFPMFLRDASLASQISYDSPNASDKTLNGTGKIGWHQTTIKYNKAHTDCKIIGISPKQLIHQFLSEIQEYFPAFGKNIIRIMVSWQFVTRPTQLLGQYEVKTEWSISNLKKRDCFALQTLSDLFTTDSVFYLTV